MSILLGICIFVACIVGLSILTGIFAALMYGLERYIQKKLHLPDIACEIIFNIGFALVVGFIYYLGGIH